MRIIEIKALPNGSHRNQSGDFIFLPEGYAVIPPDMKTENFPFGEVIAEEVDGVMTVTKWIPGVMPEIKKDKEPISVAEQLRADIEYIAIMTGVEL